MRSISMDIKCACIALAILVSGLATSSHVLAGDDAVSGVDLTVNDVYWSDMFGEMMTDEAVITSGQPYSVHAIVENTGIESIGIFSAVLYIDGTTEVGVVPVEGLGATETVTVSWSGIVTSDVGSHSATIIVDPDDLVAETNLEGTAEGNNERTESLDVVISEWTFAVYMDGDNNLELAAHWDFLELASVGTSREVNIVVQFDRHEALDTDYGDWTDAKRFLITQGMEPLPENAYENLGEVNMGDADVLSDFASDTFTRFRAEKTCLVLWDHGASWYGGCCKDESAANDTLKTDEMRDAMTTTKNEVGDLVNIIAFDACVMASIEVVYAFEGLCLEYVASEALVDSTGWPYDSILQALVTSPSMGHEEFSEVIVSEFMLEYEGSTIDTLSAFSVDAVCTDVRDAVTEFADALIPLVDTYDKRITAMRNQVNGFDIILTDPSFQDSYSADLYTFAREVAEHIHDEQVQTSAQSLMNAIDEATLAFDVVATYTPYGDIFGLMVFWPEVDVYLDEYQNERFALDTTWDEFLLAFCAV